MQIINIAIISAVILLGMAKKKRKQMATIIVVGGGKAAVNLQRAGEDVIPAEMYFGQCDMSITTI